MLAKVKLFHNHNSESMLQVLLSTWVFEVRPAVLSTPWRILWFNNGKRKMLFLSILAAFNNNVNYALT